MAMWTYSLVILWYARWSKRRVRLSLRLAPWYRNKKAPSFADMLADHAGVDRIDQNKLEPLLDAVGYA